MLYYFIAGGKRSPHLFMVSSFLLTVWWDFSWFCPHSWNACVAPTNMHGMWALKALVITWMHMQVMQQSLQAYVILLHKYCTKMGDFLIRLAGLESIYLGKWNNNNIIIWVLYAVVFKPVFMNCSDSFCCHYNWSAFTCIIIMKTVSPALPS